MISPHRRTMGQALPLAAATALALAGCVNAADDSGDPVIARAYDERLHWSDLRQVVPVEITPEDSAALAQRYIGNWIRQRAVLKQAERNLDPEKIDFEAQLRDYRNSLIIYAYEQALVDQKLDTLVNDAEIEAHYAEGRADLELQDDILRIRWFKVREDARQGADRRTLERLRSQFLGGRPEQLHEVELWLAQRGIPIVDRSQSWTPLSELRMELPVDDLGVGGAHRLVVRQLDQAWFIDILEHRTKGSSSPLELVRGDIRAIIINQRKLQLLERMREDLYREALQRKDVEVL